jgi:hypothetical protein
MIVHVRFIAFCLTPQISRARWADEPSLLNNWAMWSGNIIDDSGEIKGVALWMTG